MEELFHCFLFSKKENYVHRVSAEETTGLQNYAAYLYFHVWWRLGLLCYLAN